MPISLTLTQGVLSDAVIPVAIARITDAFLASHGLTGNKIMTPNVTAHVNIMAKGTSFSGGQPVEGAWLETRTPSFALNEPAVQRDFYGKATSILIELAEGRLTPDRVWANGVHTVDGTWNLDGIPRTNAELGAALAAA